MSYATADLSDAHEDVVGHVTPALHHYGGVTSFHGPIRTVKCFEDNSLVKSTLQTPGEGAVLVVDGGGSLRCALVGDNLAGFARDNGWAGVVVYGCLRDAAIIRTIPVGVMALNTHPSKSVKRDEGALDLEVTFLGVTFEPGAWLYADDDGVIVAPYELASV